MELRDLEYFAVIAEHCHLGRAADALHLSQPALSKSLRRLEQILDVKLVNRTPKGVELTAEGSTLLLRVRELRLSLRSVSREIADMSEGRAGQLRGNQAIANKAERARQLGWTDVYIVDDDLDRCGKPAIAEPIQNTLPRSVLLLLQAEA